MFALLAVPSSIASVRVSCVSSGGSFRCLVSSAAVPCFLFLPTFLEPAFDCFRLLLLLTGAAPVMDESAGLAVGSTSFGGKEDECDGLLLFFAGAF
jgi:hypothetical protein